MVPQETVPQFLVPQALVLHGEDTMVTVPQSYFGPLHDLPSEVYTNTRYCVKNTSFPMLFIMNKKNESYI